MGYSPQGRKELDMTEATEHPPPNISNVPPKCRIDLHVLLLFFRLSV